MGAGATSGLSRHELKEISERTTLSHQEIKALWKRFYLLDAEGRGFISLRDFENMPEMILNPLAGRILEVVNGQPPWLRLKNLRISAHNSSSQQFSFGHIDFELFLRAFEMFHPKTSQTIKNTVLFDAYDLDGDGWLGRRDLTITLSHIMGPQIPQRQAEVAADFWLRRAADLRRTAPSAATGEESHQQDLAAPTLAGQISKVAAREGRQKPRGISREEFTTLLDPTDLDVLVTASPPD